MADIPPGGARTVAWRGEPVRVVRRTPEMMAALQGHEAARDDPRSLQDQQPGDARDPARAIRPEIVVAVDLRTQLGRSPTSAPRGAEHPSLPADGPGGFRCPCQGCTFDGAGRVFTSKPAPSNLEMPPHRDTSVTAILIGDDPS